MPQGHWCRVGWDANHADFDPGRAQGSELVVGYGMFGKVLERFWKGFGKVLVVCYGNLPDLLDFGMLPQVAVFRQHQKFIKQF